MRRKLRIWNRQRSANLDSELIRNFLVARYSFDVPGLWIGPELVRFPLTLQEAAITTQVPK
jgi:hypothetical protein